MKQIEVIYNSLEKKKISSDHFFGRELVTIKKSDFNKFRKEFRESSNIFNKKKNYRSKENFIKHIHAIGDGDYMQFHYDYGNINKNFSLFILHFFIDVIPFFIWHLIKLKKPYTIK